MRTKQNENELDLGSCQYEEAARIYSELFDKSDEEIEKLISFKRLPKQSIREICEDIKKDDIYDDSEMGREMETDLHNALDKVESVEDLFQALREQAWDLWSVAPLISSYFFDYKIIDEIECETAGPILNILAQGENPEVAVALYLLKRYEIVQDVTCFSGFDT